jgi:hypothetical protein
VQFRPSIAERNSGVDRLLQRLLGAGNVPRVHEGAAKGDQDQGKLGIIRRQDASRPLEQRDRGRRVGPTRRSLGGAAESAAYTPAEIGIGQTQFAPEQEGVFEVETRERVDVAGRFQRGGCRFVQVGA